MIITIDGPAGSGKTSVARNLAKRLSMRVLQSGLMYRAAAVLLLERHGVIKFSDLGSDAVVIDSLICHRLKDSLTSDDISSLDGIEYGYENDSQIPFIKIAGANVLQLLNKFVVGLPASIISQNPQVRMWAVGLQRQVAQKYSVVAEGRDCGTVVFPEADFKFFLTASLSVRQSRVVSDSSRGIIQGQVLGIQQSIIQRDVHDQTRSIAPLVAPQDSIIVDTSAMSLDEVVEFLLSLIFEKSRSQH